MLMVADAGDGASHGEVRSVVDVELVDLANRGRAHADRERAPPDERGEPFALRRRERLGIAHTGDPVAAGTHDDRRRDDRAAGRGHADLVDADHPDEPVVPESAFVAKGGDDRSHRRLA
jgi:hypothetical protein